MSNVAEHQTIRERFLDQWTGTPSEQVIMDNGVDDAVDPAQPFVRFVIRGGPVESPTIGKTHYRASGFVWLQIFVPTQTGSAEAQQLVDEFASIFRDWQSSDGLIRFKQEEQRWIPNDEHYQVNVSVGYRAERFV